jgi:hypothetical protein
MLHFQMLENYCQFDDTERNGQRIDSLLSQHVIHIYEADFRSQLKELYTRQATQGQAKCHPADSKVVSPVCFLM